MNTINETASYPDIQFHFFEFKKGAKKTILYTEKVGYNEEIAESFMQASEEADVLMVFATLLTPKSSGYVKIVSSDWKIYRPPEIYPRYLDDFEDIFTVRRAIRILQRMSETEILKKNEAELHRMNLPECDKLKYDGDDYWECYIRHMTITLYHPVGTAKMGPSGDPSAVVDSRLKVKKVSGLRVVDGSIMPVIVSGNTNAPIMMIGEKASDLITEDWLKKKSKHTEL